MRLLFNSNNLQLYKKLLFNQTLRCFCNKSFTGSDPTFKELTNPVKLNIELNWRDKINRNHFDKIKADEKFYVLSMFPYPSGTLHMGHVRVYSISDAIARFYRMNGKNVFHPIGWDAFGLPAENAAIQRKIEPAVWTKQNILQMKEQLESLGCSFDWSHELSTCDSNYYKWTQKLFLMLYENNLIYQNEALVNWDPIDKTVLADEQVDSSGNSWRSGAKVEKKLLKQWFIRTTKFAEDLYNGLSDPTLQDWRDIINLQKHWIGECNGYSFQIKIKDESNETNRAFMLRIWSKSPEHLSDPNGFIVLKINHFLNNLNLNLVALNPFTNSKMPIVSCDDLEFPEHCNTYLAAPSFLEMDKILGERLKISFTDTSLLNSSHKVESKTILEEAKKLNIGGFKVSSKLQDWLISRQRYWGTPIPIIHCPNCGAVSVPEEDLPVKLKEKNAQLDENDSDVLTECPKCKNPNSKRETDTMDTFVDSSWYYLRYLDAQNSSNIFDVSLINKLMPVDLYIGGKEHAVLHLYYARFMNHFLHSIGLSPHPEPFKRLLVQGMVMGRSYRVKGSGKYITENEVDVIDSKKNKAIEKSSNIPVTMTWEKMSKSKLNGVDPSDMISQYGADTTRLIILADVAPTSHRNWSTATFPGILNWQNRLWLTLNDYYTHRSAEDIKNFKYTNEKFLEEDLKMFDARNYYAKGVTFNFRHTHQLSVGISKMQGLTNSIRRAPQNVVKYGKQYERALASQIIMLAPIAPHFASELWAKFIETPNRINDNSQEIKWTEDVLNQNWPDVDMEYELDLTVKVNGFENAVIKIPRRELDKITYNDAMDIAFNTESVTSFVTNKKIRTTNFVLYPGIEAILNIYLDKIDKTKNNNNIQEEKITNK